MHRAELIVPHRPPTRLPQSNFFERRVGEYQKAGVMSGLRAATAAKAAATAGGGGSGGRQEELEEGVNAIGCSFQNFKFATDVDF
jgi:hypothetical protein